jgi:hypothetical protein
MLKPLLDAKKFDKSLGVTAAHERKDPRRSRVEVMSAIQVSPVTKAGCVLEYVFLQNLLHALDRCA